MQYTRISTYDVTNGTFPELTSVVEKSFLPMLAREPGFVNYGLVDAGNQKAMAISIWETREQAQDSARVAGTWVKEHIADRVRLGTTVIGELALFRGAPVSA